jgi:hypothetical protein
MGFYPDQLSRPEPKWVDYVDYNPDHQRSSSGLIIEAQGDGAIGVFPVRGLGVLVMRADFDPASGRLMFMGLSSFTDGEIGWRR